MKTLDATDLAILRAMGVYPFNRLPEGPDSIRPPAIARRLDLRVELVKDRIARMEAAGIICGYQIYPNLHHLGLKEAVLHIDVPRRDKEAFFHELGQVDGIVGLCRFVGDAACMEMLYGSPVELERKVQRFMELAGHEESPDQYVQLGTTTPTHELGHLDWRIVQALRGNARRPYQEIADELGVHARTVRRRVQRMDDDNAIDVVVEPDFGAISGAIVFILRVHATRVTATLLSQVLERIQGTCFMALKPATPEVRTFMVDSFAFTQREVEEIRSNVAAIAGVDKVEVFHPASEVASWAWLDEAIDAMVRRSDPLSQNTDDDHDFVRMTRKPFLDRDADLPTPKP